MQEIARKRAAEEANALFAQLRTSRTTIADAAGIPQGSLQVALSPKGCERIKRLDEMLMQAADAVEERAREFEEIAREMRDLATQIESLNESG